MDLHKQKGMTALGWLIVLALIGFFAMLGIRLTPMYMESYSVKGSLESLKQEPYITDKTRREIISLLQRRFIINDISSVDLKTDITITKEGGVLEVSADYEIRRHVIGNIDAIGDFHHAVEIVER